MSRSPVARTCANCCAYQDAECVNGLGQVGPGGRCEHHETEAEFQADVAAIGKFREKLGLPPRRFVLGED